MSKLVLLKNRYIQIKQILVSLPKRIVNLRRVLIFSLKHPKKALHVLRKLLTVTMVGLIIWTFISILYHWLWLKLDLKWSITFQGGGALFDIPFTYLFEWVLMRGRGRIKERVSAFGQFKRIIIPKSTLKLAGRVANVMNWGISFAVSLEFIYVAKLIFLNSVGVMSTDQIITGIINSLYAAPIFCLILGPSVIAKKEEKNLKEEFVKLASEIFSPWTIKAVEIVSRKVTLWTIVFILNVLKAKKFLNDFSLGLWMLFSKT